MKHIFLVCLYFFFTTAVCFAITDTSVIRLQIGLDSIPPTTPNLVSVIPVAQTQIDLSWTVSTDNILLSGYQVFRDAVQIATTTLTSYSDSGLTASTSYSYFIRAFDSSANISSSSVIVSTTTLANTATSTVQSGTSSTGTDTTLELRGFTVNSEQTNVTMSWQTSRYARYELRWGRTSSYELGFVTNELYKKEHSTLITDLLSGTTYEYELVGFNKDGKKIVLKRGQFKTDVAPDGTPPTNVSNLKATVDGESVLLTWDNPQDSDFSHVRIVRNHLFYPQDPSNGFIAYSATLNSFYDKNILQNYPTQYYSVFTYDENGNISSGAIVKVQKKGVVPNIGTDPSSGQATSTASGTVPNITLQFDAIEFTQEGIKVDTNDINASVPLTVRVPYAVFPEHLKTITVTFTNPNDGTITSSFLLRINKDKSYYEAVVAPLRTVGIYPVALSFYDHQTQMVYVTEGAVTVYEKKVQFIDDNEHESSTRFIPMLLGFGIMAVCLLWILMLLLRKKRRL